VARVRSFVQADSIWRLLQKPSGVRSCQPRSSFKLVGSDQSIAELSQCVMSCKALSVSAGCRNSRTAAAERNGALAEATQVTEVRGRTFVQAKTLQRQVTLTPWCEEVRGTASSFPVRCPHRLYTTCIFVQAKSAWARASSTQRYDEARRPIFVQSMTSHWLHPARLGCGEVRRPGSFKRPEDVHEFFERALLAFPFVSNGGWHPRAEAIMRKSPEPAARQ